MATNAWEDGYAGTLPANEIDDRATRELKATRERLMQGGHKMTGAAPGASTENDDGKHVVGLENGSPAGDAGYWSVYDSAGTTARLRTHGASHATKANRTEFPGTLGHITPGSILRLEGIAYASYGIVTCYDPLPTIGYLKSILYKVPDSSGYPQRTVKAIRVTVGTKPVGANLIIKLRFRDASAGHIANNDDPFDGTNDTLIDTLTLTAGTDYAAEKTGLSQVLDPDDELIIEYTSVGTTTNAADATVHILLE